VPLAWATLIIAKLDRLARNAAFISNLMESGIEFTAVDFPQANRLTVHILAAVAEHEAKAISTRTKDALAAAMARGKRLGRDRGNLPSVANIEHAEAVLLDATTWITEAAFRLSQPKRIGVPGKIDTAEAFAGANGHKIESHASERRRGIQPLRCHSAEGPARVLGRLQNVLIPSTAQSLLRREIVELRMALDEETVDGPWNIAKPLEQLW
jgi:hypothetical protein